jgi:hypothetical protein
MGAAEMPITAYLPTSGAIFGPEAVASMGKAFEDAVAVLGIGPSDETKREVVARFIFHLAEIDGGLLFRRAGRSRTTQPLKRDSDGE